MNNIKPINFSLDVFHAWLTCNFYSKHKGYESIKPSYLLVLSALILRFYGRCSFIRHSSSWRNLYYGLITRKYKRALFGKQFDIINNMFGDVFVESIPYKKREKIAKGYALSSDMQKLLKLLEQDYESGVLHSQCKDMKVRKATTPILTKRVTYKESKDKKTDKSITKRTCSNTKETHREAGLSTCTPVDVRAYRLMFQIANLILPTDGNYEKETAFYYQFKNTLLNIREKLETDEERRLFDGMVDGANTIEDIRKMFDRIHRIKVAALFIDVVATIYGGIPMRYREVNNGRLYALGEHNLQNVPRLVRKVGLNGCFDIDFENCHFALLYSMALAIGIELHHIKGYLDNKNMHRETIAKDLGLPLSTIKTALLSLIFGALTNKDYYDLELKIRKSSALGKLLGDKLKEFKRHPLVAGIITDIKNGSEAVIIDHELKSVSRGHICNLCGVRMSSKDSRTPKRKQMKSSYRREALSFLLQGAERFILDIVIRSLDGSKIVLLQHDGITYKDELTPIELDKVISKIKDETGFDMKLEIEKLGV